ncbi:bifunctional adenosylcobinamide kinase/adenosylcobinamide-phosphate guanylyltransferase [Sinanaerobacter chloroacetimidivorans]|jgi:hypothetical protein|uniref:Bifunctional adenosylcobinamide kinase/adenosylcobinamide-phosphate guanylyltransferase n=1 Tax=Sinanaerobacter chloroacetimidivorans TaxID=2818044 RepID=A0A8J8B2U2_9FIRM|nr:bifunctional adenosylcobinamide kinase/adenosylcobinamide-phosphate guanylyltransferase [Sinanaerobacter chloroacetimidivorans]MBR0599077.1 bifunctional adenosylcobinamide kinase/adenosylcobinamide-phosphate guanylyltransferase [Sinanaerobacter chloroacetimidivorans]
MRFVFGGAYQGKLDYVKETFGIKEEEIYNCTIAEEPQRDEASLPVEIDFGKKVIVHLEAFIINCLRRGMEAKDYLELHKEEWSECIFICTDISSGIVPYEAEQRAWREMTGRTMIYLGKEAEEVTRIFCGIPQRIK